MDRKDQNRQKASHQFPHRGFDSSADNTVSYETSSQDYSTEGPQEDEHAAGRMWRPDVRASFASRRVAATGRSGK
jgi:hypothetical protein